MKQLFVIIFLACSFSSIAQVRVVKNPPFSVRNSPTLEIDSIVLSDQSTLFYLTGYSNPKYWMSISADTYINANGQKFVVQSADGIKINEKEFTDETGKRIFSLTFPAIPKGLKHIDFIESDCETCFKIWGIELTSPVLTGRIEVPQNIKALTQIKDDGKPLEMPILKAGDAKLKGCVLGYRPEMKSKVSVFYNHPIIDEQMEYAVNVANDGSFEVTVPMISTAQVLVHISCANYYNILLLTPSKETSMYIDMQQIAMNESRSRIDKTQNVRTIYFGGANSEINNQFQDLNYHDYLSKFLSHDKMKSEIVGMSAAEFKKYMMDKCSSAVAGLSDKNLTRKANDFVKECLQYDVMQYLMMGNYYLEQAYRMSNKLSRDAPIPDYYYPIFDEEYYSFLKEYNVNSPIALYSNSFSNMISGCSRLQVGMHSNHSIRSLATVEGLDQLVKIKNLSDDELYVVEDLKKNDSNHWSVEKVNAYNLYIREKIEKLLATEKLTGRGLKIAQWVIQLTNSDSNNIGSIVDFTSELSSIVNREKILGDEKFEIARFEYPGDSVIPKVERSVDITKLYESFWEKYGETLASLSKEASRKEERKPLVSILGTDKGIIFDMIDAKEYGSRLKEYKPLTEKQLLGISKMENPYYYTYLYEQNTQVVEYLKSIEGKKSENVFDAPNVADDQVLYEIVKSYAGKVVFIDFWATWCGPCLSAMKQFEPTKHSFEGKDVVFIYLTDESSPEKLWEAMVPKIDGKHYRLKNSQFEYLKKKYGARGIPSYLILNKAGEKVYFHVGFESSEQLEKILNDELAK